jgi:hypothetical protein
MFDSDVVELYVKEKVDGLLMQSVDTFHQRLRETPDELLAEIAMDVIARPGAQKDTLESIRGRTKALLVRRIYALDWLVRAYNRRDRLVDAWVIENRTDKEAVKEAEADIPDHAVDYSLQAITPGEFKATLAEQPELRAAIGKRVLPRAYQMRTFKDLNIGEYFFFASNLTPGQMWQKVSARRYVKPEDPGFCCRVGSIYVQVDPPVPQRVIDKYLAENKTGNPRFVYSRHGSERGELTGGVRACPMEGCTGQRLGVRWPDKRITWPCTKGMSMNEDGQWQIG